MDTGVVVVVFEGWGGRDNHSFLSFSLVLVDALLIDMIKYTSSVLLTCSLDGALFVYVYARAVESIVLFLFDGGALCLAFLWSA